jgi:hypothetical protein
MHRDVGGSAGPFTAGGAVEGVERTPSKGAGLASGLKVPRMLSGPPPAPAPNMPGENGGMHDLTDGVKVLALDEES